VNPGALPPMNDIDFVISEHPAWSTAVDGGRLRVFAMPDGGRWLVHTTGTEFSLHPLGPAETPRPVYDTFRLPPDALHEVPELACALTGLGTVARFRTSHLWEAIGAAIIRQAMRAVHTTNLYRAFCQTYGEPVDLPDGDRYWHFPTPQTVLALTAGQFHDAGLAFKRGVLRDAATVYLRHELRWQHLPPHALVDQLQQIPRVGTWTALVAVTDWSNDWALYPAGDLPIRTWVRRAARSHPWPTDERTFSNAWRALTGAHLPQATLLTLAWGNRHTAPPNDATTGAHPPPGERSHGHDGWKGRAR
jgi:DNA-3-methyladenine glycosylase II